MPSIEMPMERVDRIRARFADFIEEVQTEKTDTPIFFVKLDKAVQFLESVGKEEGFEFNFLSDLTAIDDNPPTDLVPDYGLGTVLPEKAGVPRFAVVYQLLSMQHKERIRVKVRVKAGQECPTVTGLWQSANWLEREVFDMYGIRFKGHPDLTRIMLDNRWVGHPQRKDYPIKRYQRFAGSMSMTEAGLNE